MAQKGWTVYVCEYDPGMKSKQPGQHIIFEIFVWFLCTNGKSYQNKIPFSNVNNIEYR